MLGGIYEGTVSLVIKNMTFNKVLIFVTHIIAINNTFSVMRWYVLSSTGYL